jgi:hypothetical protein
LNIFSLLQTKGNTHDFPPRHNILEVQTKRETRHR